jgi:hypothetical protein
MNPKNWMWPHVDFMMFHVQFLGIGLPEKSTGECFPNVRRIYDVDPPVISRFITRSKYNDKYNEPQLMYNYKPTCFSRGTTL